MADTGRDLSFCIIIGCKGNVDKYKPLHGFAVDLSAVFDEETLLADWT